MSFSKPTLGRSAAPSPPDAPRSSLQPLRPPGWVLAFLPFAALLLIFFVVPLGTFFRYAFENGLSDWRDLFSAPGTAAALHRTIVIALQTTAACGVLSYLYCSALVRAGSKLETALLLAVVVPFLTSILVRSYAWIIVLGNSGPINEALRLVLGPQFTVQLLYTRIGVMIGMVHVLLPLFVLPLYAVMSRIPQDLKRAARAMGANRVEVFLRVTLPLSLPGAAAGAALVFIQALGFFVTPSLLGGAQDTMVAQLMDRELSQFIDLNDAAVLGAALVLTVLLLVAAFRIFYPLELLFVQGSRILTPPRRGRRSPLGRKSSGRWRNRLADKVKPVRLGLTAALARLPWTGITKTCAFATAAFFVLPLMVVIPISFTGEAFLHFPPDSYSFRWYEAVLTDPLWRGAALNSLVTGALVTLLCAAVGLPLAVALVRSGMPQQAKGVAVLLIVLPALVPVIVLAIGVFVWFLQLQIVDSLLALSAAHALLGLPFLVIVVMAALRDFDVRLERAARSLGAGMWKTYVLITVPILKRAVVAGLFFAFLVSFDELLIARAVTSVGTTTLPVQLWIGAREEISPALGVVSTLSIMVTLLAAGVVFALRRQLRRGPQDVG